MNDLFRVDLRVIITEKPWDALNTVGRRFPVWLILWVCVTGVMAGESIPEGDWWPSQAPPERIVEVSGLHTLAESNLAQSISGLAAAAVNNGKHDELVWIKTDNPEYVRLLDRTVQILEIPEVRTVDVWKLLAEYKDKLIVRGYVLYTSGHENIDKDASVNIATTMAGFEEAVIVEHSLESRVRELGLPCLGDADVWTMQKCFQTYDTRANRNMLAAINPGMWNMRDMAIAHRCFTVYGADENVSQMMQWLNPLSVIIGWNKGDENQHVGLATRWGHFETASDFCMNFPVISSIRSRLKQTPVSSVKPWEIDYNQGLDFASFMYTDGDNVQWTIGGFSQGETLWKSPFHGSFPMSWSSCSAHLVQISPETFHYLSKAKPPSTCLVEFGGGYFFPDTFAVGRPNRPKILQRQAQRLSAQLQKSGVRVVCAIYEDVLSEGAKEAYRIFTRQIEELVGMVAIQYAPYDGGNGEVFWYPNKNGIDIPVMTVKYSLWADAGWPRGGKPDKIASLLKENASKNNDPTFSVVITHAWSQYERSKDTSEKVSGLEPVKWLYDRIHEEVSVVNVEELLWRLRMAHDPSQTKHVIETINKTSASR